MREKTHRNSEYDVLGCCTLIKTNRKTLHVQTDRDTKKKIDYTS